MLITELTNMKKPLFYMLLLFISGCASIPDGVQPVTGFEVNRYLGKWYEIARLDHSFERGLNNVSAEYSLRSDGTIRVLNRGYNVNKNEWQEAEGRAKYMGSPDVASLKVSFFGPFYGGYNIVELDKQNYQYVMIAGNDRSYLWILSRTPTLNPNIRKKLVEKAKVLGFPVDKLIYVSQEQAQ
jgi:apolipoprotein D and lipocalin family protein